MDSEENLPELQTNDKPQIGMTFASEEEAYQFYNRYGGSVGFSVRRAYLHKDNDDPTIIKSRSFVCNKAGTRGVDKRDKGVKKPRAETRTQCLAKMSISRMRDGLYVCREFVEEHNHELHTQNTRHFMRSQRSITDLQGVQIDMADDVGIRPKAAFDYMGIQSGGIQNIGYTRTDLKNFLRTKRQNSLQYGEAGALSEYFETQQRLNPSFSSRLQYDNEEQVTNIFWADPRMLIDYYLFGDVVVFDTTFCTNKENRPLGVFSGFNHHRGATIFGAALLYDETTDSFKWLFETFLEVHGQKKPKTIFTDQDTAMGNAISEVMPETWHGLCTWHIMQNAIKNLANLIKQDRSILTEFKRCMYEIESEMEFEEAWQQLHTEHQTSNNSWLNRMYGLKKKWARCYMNQTFTAGVRSTQLSESMNSDLKDYLRRSLDLKQFFTQFERVVEDKRANELKADFDAANTRPHMMGLFAPMLMHAAKVYTPKIYSLFEVQYKWMGACAPNKRDGVGEVDHYSVSIVNEYGHIMEEQFDVGFIHSGPFVACSCRYFETVGILCMHALKILDVYNVKTIPEAYILPRWTKAVRGTVVEDETTGDRILENANLTSTQGFRIICPQFVKLSAQASTSSAGLSLAQTYADNLRRDLAALHIDSPSTVALDQNVPQHTELVLKTKEKHRGSTKRHKGWVGSYGRGRRQGSTSTDERQQQTVSQEMLTQFSMHGYHNTMNRTNFTGFLTGMHSSQESPLSDGVYQSQTPSSQVAGSSVQRSVPDFFSQLPDRRHDG